MENFRHIREGAKYNCTKCRHYKAMGFVGWVCKESNTQVSISLIPQFYVCNRFSKKWVW